MSEPVQFEDSILPWNGTPVRMCRNLESYFAGRLHSETTRYLPGSITLFSDVDIEDSAVLGFLLRTTEQLSREVRERSIRRNSFIQLGLFSQEEMESFLTARRQVQPWAIYYSSKGGLGALHSSRAYRAVRGIIPCSAMQNHGVAWNRTDNGEVRIWLATARKEGHDWDWDSDIGHESAHAAFAPVPLFAQGEQLDVNGATFSAVRHFADLDTGHLAWLAYLYSEIAVVTLRGEQRPTQTGLPIPEKAELYAFLELSHQLMPTVGFDRAMSACARVNAELNVRKDKEMYEIAAPIIRIVPAFTKFTSAFDPPTIAWYRTVGADLV